MDRVEYWRTVLRTLSPFLGFIAGAWALTLGMEGLSAGFTYGSVGGYLVAAVAFVAGYVVVRWAWVDRVDSVFVLGLVALTVVSVYALLYLETPPSVFERIARW
ncbi:MAG: hypothetical protein ABEI31_08035 [Halodesulfurarchaeum sp.]